jgi:high-affinity Fe2+/Pb2+ permease
VTVVGRVRTALPGGPLGVAALVIGLALAGATAFGLWHLVVGGLISGNPRAGTFGLILAAAAGLLLVAWVWLLRRSRRRVA